MLGSEVKILDKNIANMIAAGEVVERPASVVKELVENAFDAAATEVTVEIKNGGKTYIRVTDNGIGMTMSNARKAFLRHATSKIQSEDDLFRIGTMGFRGEALAAISAVSRVELMTSTVEDAYGSRVIVEGGDEIVHDEMGLAKGTTIIVKDLFYNTPARYNFLKKDSTETANIVSLVQRLAISRSCVAVKLIVDNKLVFSTDGNADDLDVIYTVLGKDISDNLLEAYRCNARIKITGYVGKPRCSRSNRNYQLLFVNGRYVKSKTVTAAIDKAYHNLLMNNKYAVSVLFIDIAATNIDVNVHPTKMEIKFSDESFVFEMIYKAVKEALEKEQKLNVTTQQETEKPAGFENILTDLYNNLSGDSHQISMGVSSNVNPGENNADGDNTTVKQNDDYFVSVPPKTEFIDYSPRLNSKLAESGYLSRHSKLDISELSEIYAPEKYDESYIFVPEIQYKYVGELFKTYIIIESGTFYYLVDKHAAHERIVFNKIYEEYKKGEKYRQTLIQPIPVSLSPEEADVAHRYKQQIEDYGYTFSEFGDDDVLIRTVPYMISLGDTVSSFTELIQIFSETGEADITEYENRTMKMLACKAAIKAGFDSSDMELERFIKQLIYDNNINYCPHGRPIICEYSIKDIEKDFKRKL